MKPSRTQKPSKRQFWTHFGPHFAIFLRAILAPKTGANSGQLLDWFLDSVLVPKCGPNWPEGSPKSEQKAQKRAKTSSKWLYEEVTKTLYFTMVLGPPSCPKRPEESQKALIRPSCTPRNDQEDSTKATQAASCESGPKTTPKRHKKESKKRARNGSESRSEKGSEHDVRKLAELSGAGSESQRASEP